MDRYSLLAAVAYIGCSVLFAVGSILGDYVSGSQVRQTKDQSRETQKNPSPLELATHQNIYNPNSLAPHR